MAETTATTLKLDVGVKQRLKRLAEAHERSPHWLMKRAIEEYVDREEKREQLRKDILEASAHYYETGLHLAAEEADAWLEKLENGEDVDPPECHV